MIDDVLLDVACPFCPAQPLELCTVGGRRMESTVHYPRRVRADVPLITGPVRPKLDLCMAEKHAWTAENVYTSKDGRELCRPCRNSRKNRIPRSGGGERTHCIHNHEYTPENTYITASGARRCRTCNRAHVQRAKDKKKI